MEKAQYLSKYIYKYVYLNKLLVLKNVFYEKIIALNVKCSLYSLAYKNVA